VLPVQAILDTTKASFAMEGMYATEYDEKNIIDVLTGNRSLEDVLKEIKKKYIVEKEYYDGQQLSTVEREISIVKAAVLADSVTGDFDLEHLKSIHKFLFEDIYEWAGKIRTVDIAKGNIFCLVPFIEMQFAEL